MYSLNLIGTLWIAGLTGARDLARGDSRGAAHAARAAAGHFATDQRSQLHTINTRSTQWVALACSAGGCRRSARAAERSGAWTHSIRSADALPACTAAVRSHKTLTTDRNISSTWSDATRDSRSPSATDVPHLNLFAIRVHKSPLQKPP